MCVCVCDRLFDLERHLLKDHPLIRSKQQAKERQCVCVCGTGEAGVFSLLLTQDNGTAKDGASEHSLN